MSQSRSDDLFFVNLTVPLGHSGKKEKDRVAGRMLVRICLTASWIAALGAASAAGQTLGNRVVLEQSGGGTQAATEGETRPSMATVSGDTGFWFVPTADVLPSGRIAASVFRANTDRQQGLIDVSDIGVTLAYGATDRLELFSSFSLIRLDRDVEPFYNSADLDYGGVANEFPYQRTGWSKTLGSPLNVGAKWNLLSQSRRNGLSVAPRLMFSLPTGPRWGHTDALVTRAGLVVSGEAGEQVEYTGNVGAVLRSDPDAFDLSNGVLWGVGASFPSRASLRAIVEAWGETAINDEVRVTGGVPQIVDDGSVQPLVSPVPQLSGVKFGVVWQARPGFYLHGGAQYTLGVGDRTVGGRAVSHTGWDADVSIGWHPGTRRYVAPPVEPPPAPVASPPRVVQNRNPTLTAMCDPCTLEVGQTSMLVATGIDPDGDLIVYRWSSSLGSFANDAVARTTWTAPDMPGSVTLMVTVEDGRGGSATANVPIQVNQRIVIEFDPVLFDFDRFNLRADAQAVLDRTVATLQATPGIRVTIEGHTDSIGTLEYNIALGDRRARAVFDHLVSLGINANRMQTVTFGEERPVAPNDTAEGRPLNRRAAFVIILQ